jgi:DNA-binding HxlR family transcriptional regulator
MTKPRSYRLQCPIARALDRVGDRWALFILRDLHAGPARFGDLQAGLPGLASNLLTTRLKQLMADGLIEHQQAEHGAMVYALTPVGEQTAPILFELAMFGSQFPAPPDRRRPGNLRTVAVTLQEALRRVLTNEEMRIEFTVDDEPFAIDIGEGQVRVSYKAASDAPLAVATEYEAMMTLADGNMSMQEFSRKHVELRRGTKKAAKQFAGLLAKAFSK